MTLKSYKIHSQQADMLTIMRMQFIKPENQGDLFLLGGAKVSKKVFICKFFVNLKESSGNVAFVEDETQISQ